MEGILCWRKRKSGYVIHENVVTVPSTDKTNYINNKKYNFVTFVPKILYNQFRFFFNLYFLFLCVTQLFEIFVVGFFVTYVGPLCFVVGLTMLKEGWDDHKRYKRDKKYNEELFKCLDFKSKKFIPKQSQKLKPGDIIQLEKGNRVPADLIILATKTPNSSVYLKTDQLDGETDWKVRESIKSMQGIIDRGEIDLTQVKYAIEVPPPTNKIYEFRGKATLESYQTEPLRLQNTAWSSTTVAAGDFYGIVIYVGKDTRIQMNANQARIKFPICDFEVNSISKFLFVFCVLISFFLTALRGFKGLWIAEWIKFLVLLCCVIPQSLRTNLDLVKLIYAYRITNDTQIEGTICRNSQMCEDLGRINFLLSDKTGTLTRNEMIFKKITTGLLQFTEEDFDELKRTIEKGSAIVGDKLPKKVADLNMLMYSLILCNNVQPCIDNEGKRFLQSSSPDEIALVEFAEQMGFFMHQRERLKIMVKEPSTGEDINEYTILENFPFSSARKRMGIVLRIERTGKLIYFLKGADTVIKEKVERNADVVVEEADNLAREGLRTLAFCYKFLEEDEYLRWKDKYHKVTTSLHCTEEDEDRIISELEQGMKFNGISGVEDLLQEGIRETIESLREGSIKVWVLTGDKVETAKCIAKSTGLKQKHENFFDMLEDDPLKIENQIVQIMNKKDVLVIEGKVLAKIYEKGLEKQFFLGIQHLNAIMFCRCSPTQKAQIVKSVQTHCKGVVCGIGN
jgi:phospholipid-translocating ATPase